MTIPRTVEDIMPAEAAAAAAGVARSPRRDGVPWTTRTIFTSVSMASAISGR